MNLSKIICLIPVYNDWESLSILLSDIEKVALLYQDYHFSAIVINDGSTEPKNKEILEKGIDVKVVDLKLNIGHQRAIAVGLQYILNERINLFNESETSGHVVVLDGDGEDKPLDIIPMVRKAKDKIVFAKRVKRSEGIGFKTGYYLYKLIFKSLTGRKINFGNFSAIPFTLLGHVAILPNLWNHYASSIAESKINVATHPTERGRRYAGRSKMNITNLIIHGLSSISIYFEILCFRLLKILFLIMLFCFLLLGVVLISKLFTDIAVPGWALTLTLIILSVVVQLFSVTFIILLFHLNSRKVISHPNLKLYKKFINT